MPSQPIELNSNELSNGLIRALRGHSDALGRVPFDKDVSASWRRVLAAARPVLKHLGVAEAEELVETHLARLRESSREGS